MSRPLQAVDVFQAIADPTRRGILELLGQNERPVNELAAQFDVTLSAISQHIRILREAGLVTVRPEGRSRYYRINPKPLRAIMDWVEQYEQFWQVNLTALGEHLEEHV